MARDAVMQNASEAGTNALPVIFIVIVSLLLVGTLLGLLWYLYRLRDQFFAACKEAEDLALFASHPMGLPAGSVRSTLALVIVVISVGYIIINRDIPNALTAVLGTVLGFYFGTRSVSGRTQADEVLENEVERLKTSRNEVVETQQKTQVGEMVERIGKGIAMTKTVTAVLPKNLREKYEGLIDKMEQGAETVKDLAGAGSLSVALERANAIFDLFKSENPVKERVEKAMGSFGRVLGTAVPSLGLITGIVKVGANLTGMAYQKWKARILHLPFSPAVLPPALIDANTGFVLLLKSPILKEAFRPELEANDRPFMEEAATAFLQEESMDQLWTTYKDRFESRAAFEEGVEAFRRAAADMELEQVIEAEQLAEVGGYESLVSTVDRLHADDEARADLDALVTVFEGLQRNGEPVLSILEKVKKEVTS